VLDEYESNLAIVSVSSNAIGPLRQKLQKSARANLDPNVLIAELDISLTEAQQRQAAMQKALTAGATKLGADKAKLEATKKKLEAAKAKRTQDIAARVADVKRITDGIATIGQAVNKLAVSRSKLNKVYNDTLDNLRMTEPKYLSVMKAASFLEQKKADVSKEVIQLAVTVADCKDRIAKNLVVINQLRSQKAKSDGALDPSTLAYIQSLGQDAHRDLRKFLYYVVKAYEYYTLAPWNDSYLDAQKIFEDLRRLMEPSNFSNLDIYFEGVTKETKDKKQVLEKLLKMPENRQDGVLQPEEFDLLRLVYQKPLGGHGQGPGPKANGGLESNELHEPAHNPGDQ
jgi:predicted  nucleic acid-binding Zn-ribbon protein